MGKIVYANKSSVKKSWLDRYCEMSFQKKRDSCDAEPDVASVLQELRFARELVQAEVL